MPTLYGTSQPRRGVERAGCGAHAGARGQAQGKEGLHRLLASAVKFILLAGDQADTPHTTFLVPFPLPHRLGFFPGI